jgi:hypothetical protein
MARQQPHRERSRQSFIQVNARVASRRIIHVGGRRLPMKNFLGVVLLAVALVHSSARAGEVIAHPSIRLSADEIRAVFLGEKRIAGGVRLTPVDNRAERAEFVSQVLQTDETTYFARQAHRGFRQRGNAHVDLRDDDEVIAYVRATPGAIGYIGRSASEGVAVLLNY